MIDHLRFQQLIKSLYGTVEELELMFPGRHFTPDGHMVGSIGECLVADAYNLELQPASNKGFDAISSLGQEVEIKATQLNRVAFRHAPQFAIVIRIFPDGNFEEIYNGPGRLIWDLFLGKSLPSNGQHQVSTNKLAKLNESVEDHLRIKKRITVR